MRKIGIIIVAVIATGVALCAFALWPREKTLYTSGFNEATFGRLKFGATASDVKALLGSPITVRQVVVGERWIYCLSDQRAIERRHFLENVSEVSIDTCPEVEFDSTGHVRDAIGFKDKLRGATAATVRSVAGAPRIVRSGGTLTTWYYSRARESGDSYKQVTVTFDGEGRVIDKNVVVLAD